MKVFVITLCLVLTALASPVKNEKRLYYPEEERKNDNRHFVTMEDEHGNVHHVNLRQPYNDSSLATISDITVYLHTRQNPNYGDGFVIKGEDFDGTINTPLYDPAKRNVFSFHGWIGTYLSNTNRITKDGILARDDVNVFIVDYSRPAGEFYTIARASVPIVGDLMADFINKLMDKYAIRSDQFMLVGQSLGAQVIGSIGSKMNGLPSTIVGLDAAGILFYVDEPEDCLDVTDAEFVHGIHTNGGMLGMRSSYGHADFHPNGGGVNQPGCGADLAGTCAHYRAYYLWEESLATSGFRSVKCTNYEHFTAGTCDSNEAAYMGEYPIDKTIRGDYFLDTAGIEPFALG